MDKLKNIDWKQFGINHGEKIGVVVVVGLAALVLAKSEWFPDHQIKGVCGQNVCRHGRQ